jgi:hypothetical protein
MVELTINEIIEVFLVIILGVMILFFVVGGGGKMGPLWDKFCETFPQFCGGDATALEYEMATNSAEALTRAINCVIRGDSDCGSVSATEVAEMQTEATVSCREGDIQDLGEITFAAWGGETEAENYCRGSCGEEDCEISLAREGEVTFYVSQKEKTLVRCDCYCDGSQEGSVFGLVAEHAEQECGNKCVSGTAEVKNCHNFDVDLTKTGKESTMFYQDILKKKVEILPVVGKQCLCKNPGDESDNHHAYGTVPTSVIGMCAGGGYSGDTQDCSDFEGKLLFYKDDDIINMQKSSPKFRCEKTLQTVKCTIYDFSLPQKVSNVQEYVINYGDPAFMLYWNEFPIDENTWTFEPDWKVHALIAAISVFPLGKSLKVGAEIAWTAIKGPSKRLVAKVLAKDVVKEVGEDALVPIFGRTFTKELLSESSEDVIYNAFKKQIGKKELMQR